VVERVMSGGWVDLWNQRSHPPYIVQAHDCIVQVNGIDTWQNLSRMAEELRSDCLQVRFTVQRSGGLTPDGHLPSHGMGGFQSMPLPAPALAGPDAVPVPGSRAGTGPSTVRMVEPFGAGQAPFGAGQARNPVADMQAETNAPWSVPEARWGTPQTHAPPSNRNRPAIRHWPSELIGSAQRPLPSQRSDGDERLARGSSRLEMEPMSCPPPPGLLAPQGSSENMKSPNVPMLTGAVSQARAITDAPVNFAACDGNNMPPRPQFRRLKEVPQPVEVAVPPFSNGSGMKASPSMSHSSPRNPPWPRMWGNPAREPDASPFLEPEAPSEPLEGPCSAKVPSHGHLFVVDGPRVNRLRAASSLPPIGAGRSGDSPAPPQGRTADVAVEELPESAVLKQLGVTTPPPAELVRSTFQLGDDELVALFRAALEQRPRLLNPVAQALGGPRPPEPRYVGN